MDESIIEIAKNLLSIWNNIEWDNDEEKWYLGSEETYDNIIKLAEYVIKINNEQIK